MKKSKLDLELLKNLLAQPTAPFRETHVSQFVQMELAASGVPFFQDPVGNIIVGAESKQAYLARVSQKTTQPLPFFIAHMDHPGFHGLKWLGRDRLKVQWHGGSPTQKINGARVWLADDWDWQGEGRIVSHTLDKNKRHIHEAIIKCKAPLSSKHHKAQALFGGFGFRNTSWISGSGDKQRIYTKAADDLVGVFVILSLAIKYGQKTPFLALISRAEEVGFVGATAHFELGWIQKARRPLLAVSLETSRTLPGAVIGKGAVVRLGDKAGPFSTNAVRVFSDAAEKKLPGRHQRRLMDGGSCEATSALAYGLQAVGISAPLGNYHNQSFEGGPDARHPMGPAPEFVSLQDVQSMLELSDLLLSLPPQAWRDPWAQKRTQVKKIYQEYQSLLRHPI